MSFLLVLGMTLLLQSLLAIRATSPGFSTSVLATGVDLLGAGYETPRARTFVDELLRRVQGLPGVEAAAWSRVRPFSYRSFLSAPIVVDGYQPPRDELPSAEYNEISEGYLATLGIPLVSGREFTRNDDERAPLVAVVNQVMAARYWPGQDPTGKRLQVKGRWMQVVGVARTSKYMSILETPKALFYVPLRQNFSLQANLFIRTTQSAESMATALAGEIHSLDPDLAAYEVAAMRETVDRKASSQQMAVSLLAIFGGLALVLAAIGLYGVMSYAVSQSTHELGLRMALGAQASDVMRLVFSHGLGLTLGGGFLGAAVSLGTTRLLGYLLYGVSPRDPLSFALAFAVMTAVSLAACFLPAWRAAHTDPVRALRE